MPRRFLQRHLPNADTVREHPLLRPVSHLLREPELWRLHRRSVGGACFIGMFSAFLPLPGQTLVAAGLAIASRCNLPIALVLVQVTNPLTMPPMFFFAYGLGAWLLGVEATVTNFELSWAFFTSQLEESWQPLLLGSLICGWVSGLTLMVAARLLWRFHVLKGWQARRAARQQAKSTASMVR